jgi:hypothetical protein
MLTLLLLQGEPLLVEQSLDLVPHYLFYLGELEQQHPQQQGRH